jgi:hypothetical protein
MLGCDLNSTPVPHRQERKAVHLFRPGVCYHTATPRHRSLKHHRIQEGVAYLQTYKNLKLLLALEQQKGHIRAESKQRVNGVDHRPSHERRNCLTGRSAFELNLS